jgi:hypothetical protein
MEPKYIRSERIEDQPMPIRQRYYDDAAKLVKRLDERDTKIKSFKIELGALLQTFSKIVFQKFPKTGQMGIIFAGLSDDKLKAGASKCNNDPFIEEIGKLLAVRRALGKATTDIDNFLAEYNDILKINTEK